jgi:iron complex outermembrane receptor protein
MSAPSALARGAPAKPARPAAQPGASGSAVSEELVFENIPVVITASRHEQKAGEAPASVAIITAAEIERYGYRTLGEALQSVPGLYINYDHDYTYIGVRGFARPGDYNSRIQMQINGHPMNDNVWDYSAVGEDQGLDISMVERIEVVYGPGSALYGSNAVLATINVITRPPASVRGTELALEGGSFDRGQARITCGAGAGAWNLAASGSVLHAVGDNLFFPEYKALGQNGGVAEGADFEKAYRFYASAERGPLFIQASSMYRLKGIPTGAFATVFNEDATRNNDGRTFLDVQYRKALRQGMTLMLRGSYDEYRYWGTYRYDAGGGLLVDNIDDSSGRWISQEAQINYQASARHHLTVGQGFVSNYRTHIGNYDDTPFVEYADLSTDFTESSVYAQHEYTPAAAWHLTMGVRYDDYSSFGSALSPRFALVYAPENSWRLKVLAGRAFRAPNVYELYFENYSYVPPASLDPETVDSYELAFESSLGRRLEGRLAVYEDRIRDLISLVEISPGINQFSNLDEAVTRGGELALRTRFANGTDGYFSYSLMRARDGDGNQLSNYPAESIKAGVSAPFGKDRWRASLNLQYYDRRLTLQNTWSPTVFLTNMTVVAPLLHRNARLSASVHNLFDRDYGLPASAEHQDLVLIPQDGRTFSLRLQWKF